jgi:arabinofuranosyltransferase
MNSIVAGIKTRPLTLLFLSVFLIAIVRTAWVCDDAYITMRTVDNFVNGYGLTWNPSERVQVYTHPLWMLLLSGVYYFSRHAYLTLIILSLLCSAAAVIWVAFGIFREDLQASLSLALLCVSMAFIEYATSGLENPLTYLLLAIFLSVYLRQDRLSNMKEIFIVALLTALSAMSRLDLALFFIPVLLERLFTLEKKNYRQPFAALLAGFSPLIAWELFSLVYYGALVPNTAYAKLNTGVPQQMLLAQGGRYFLDVLRWDAITLLVAAAGAVFALWKGSRRARALGVGIFLYLGFVAWVGGDFMRGRFFAAPFLVGAVLLVYQLARYSVSLRKSILVIVALIGIGWAVIRPAFMYNEPLIAKSGIANERGFYVSATGLFNVDLNGVVPNHDWIHRGIQLQREGTRVSVQDTIGFHGYFAGPQVHIVDRLALADPLLARLPVPDPAEWRIGHFYREIPAGYLESLPDRENRIVDPRLADFYDRLRLITRGNLYDPLRLQAILKMNLGYYDDLIDSYVNR